MARYVYLLQEKPNLDDGNGFIYRPTHCDTPKIDGCFRFQRSVPNCNPPGKEVSIDPAIYLGLGFPILKPLPWPALYR